jgi:hypothetical protein
MELYQILKMLTEAFDSLGIEYILTGGLASVFYGEPRFTDDIDIVADLKKERVRGLLEFFSKEEFYISEESIKNAIEKRFWFNIIYIPSGIKIDVNLKKATDFDESRFRRKRKVAIAEGVKASLASCEDVIIMKMEYYRESESERHLRDIEGMLKVTSVDRSYITEWPERLGLSDIWKEIE